MKVGVVMLRTHLYKFKDDTEYKLYNAFTLDLTDLTYKVISLEPIIKFSPPVDKIVWIQFTRGSSNKIKIQMNDQKIRILGIRDIAQIELGIHNDTPNDRELYLQIMNNYKKQLKIIKGSSRYGGQKNTIRSGI